MAKAKKKLPSWPPAALRKAAQSAEYDRRRNAVFVPSGGGLWLKPAEWSRQLQELGAIPGGRGYWLIKESDVGLWEIPDLPLTRKSGYVLVKVPGRGVRFDEVEQTGIFGSGGVYANITNGPIEDDLLLEFWDEALKKHPNGQPGYPIRWRGKQVWATFDAEEGIERLHKQRNRKR